MEIQQFRYFLAAARYENLTKAAEDLHIAQPALSQSIKRLEKSPDRAQRTGETPEKTPDPDSGIHR